MNIIGTIALVIGCIAIYYILGVLTAVLCVWAGDPFDPKDPEKGGSTLFILTWPFALIFVFAMTLMKILGMLNPKSAVDDILRRVSHKVHGVTYDEDGGMTGGNRKHPLDDDYYS